MSVRQNEHNNKGGKINKLISGNTAQREIRSASWEQHCTKGDKHHPHNGRCKNHTKKSTHKKSEATDLLHQILSGNGLEDILFAGFLHLSPQHELVQHEEGFLKVEDDVQLTHLRNGDNNCSQIHSQTQSA